MSDVGFPHSRAAAKGTRFERLYDTPSHWPDDVHFLTNDNMGMLGRRARTNELLWDGSPLVTMRRFTDFERRLAMAGLLIALIGVVATVVQAYAALAMIPPAT